MNRITDDMQTGALGELLVQLRLLEYGVQAAPPIKDSGNDLIAIKGEVFKAIQVKTRTGSIYEPPEAGSKYHILAVVQLNSDETQIYLDKSSVFLIPKDKVNGLSRQFSELGPFRINSEYVETLFL